MIVLYSLYHDAVIIAKCSLNYYQIFDFDFDSMKLTIYAMSIDLYVK